MEKGEDVEESATLYVGDLDVSVTEEDLRRLFHVIGDVINVNLCKDELTQQSLGYGFIDYRNPQHAAKAIGDLNFTTLNGKSIRVAHYNADCSLRTSGVGNIFVKNLDKEIDNKALYKMFSPFGSIVSSKIGIDSLGHSKGYGFVQYTTQEAAKNAIEQLNGFVQNGNELYIGPFVSKSNTNTFTNVFVKNILESTTEEDLTMLFGRYGSITSVVVMKDEMGNPKCYGFVNFEKAEDAATAVQALNGIIFKDTKLFVGRAKKKSEREREGLLGMNNLYLKNLDDEIDNEKLNELFSPFGTITSCKVMSDPNGISKGSGFVAFSTSQEASKAMSEMNGKMICKKPLYVAFAEKKEVRRARLESLLSLKRANTVPPAITPQTSNVQAPHVRKMQSLVSNMLPNTTSPAVTTYMPMYPAVQPIHYGHTLMPRFGYQQFYAPRPYGAPLRPFLLPVSPWAQVSPKQKPSARLSNCRP